MVIIGDVPAALDYRGFALKRAGQLGVFAGQPTPTVFEDNFENVPGDAGSQFQIVTQLGAAGTVTGTGAPGGVIRLDTTAAASKGVLPRVGKATGTIPSMIADPVASGSRWYLLWAFAISSTFDAQTIAIVNMLSASGSGNQLYFGFDGQFGGSSTNFMAEDNANHTVSTVVPGAAGTWHYLEAWQVGVANQVLFRFDNEPTLTLTLGAAGGNSLGLRMEAANGTTASSRTLDVDHLVVLMPGNVTLPG